MIILNYKECSGKTKDVTNYSVWGAGESFTKEVKYLSLVQKSCVGEEMVAQNEGHPRRNTALCEKAQSQNVSGTLGHSEKLCGAGAQNMCMFVGRQVGVEIQKRGRERREVGSIFTDDKLRGLVSMLYREGRTVWLLAR